ncbi:hypothetical protein EBBID32_12950 [Sphingobium indicum BiD32]|uniref:Phosphoadenosine phosphosulphate reductase domain-containing protein n=1 Tax=Sphingobium indicum BiD32 TaxID=1301087 RepID=N1MJ11_9SPHN|nr:hypothetical protein [Sphingobium indicum]CCW16956.1 hypothetical protein EBBID32_12950 [Sphingobium indicum BiD32]
MTATAGPPVIVAWGAGVDSTAMILEMATRRQRIDMVLIAQMPEKPETQAFIPAFRRWMDDRDIPNEIVANRPRRFGTSPAYFDLLEACLINGALPSIAFGRGTCSLRWKVSPQDAWTKTWPPAQQAWATSQKVIRLIGFDSSLRDSRRYAHAEGYSSSLYTYRYPLREWGWGRDACNERIRQAGFEVPASSCFFCTGMQCDEVRALPAWCLRLIILMEARAKPRLKSCEGLWRSTTKGLRGREARPGSMTRFIRDEGLLPAHEIDWIAGEANADLTAFLSRAAALPFERRQTMHSWINGFIAHEVRAPDSHPEKQEDRRQYDAEPRQPFPIPPPSQARRARQVPISPPADPARSGGGGECRAAKKRPRHMETD